MGIFGETKDTSTEGYKRAIANVQALGAANASKQDVEMTKKYANLGGELGNKARKALGK